MPSSAAQIQSAYVSQGEFSFMGLPRWLARRAEVTPTAKLVYGYLLSRHNAAYGYAWPAVATIADDLGVSTRTVNRVLAELERLRLIERERRGKQLTNTYRFPRHRWMAERHLEVVEGDATDQVPQEGSDAPLEAQPMKTYSDEEPMGTTPTSSGRRTVRGVAPENPSDDDFAETIGMTEPQLPNDPPPVKPRRYSEKPKRPRPGRNRPDDVDDWHSVHLAAYFTELMEIKVRRGEIPFFAGIGNEGMVSKNVKAWLDSGIPAELIKRDMDFFAENYSTYARDGVKPGIAFIRADPLIRKATSGITRPVTEYEEINTWRA